MLVTVRETDGQAEIGRGWDRQGHNQRYLQGKGEAEIVYYDLL